MTASPLDRQRAASRTRLAQAGVFVAIACGGGIVAFGLPGVKPPPPVEPLTLPEPAPEETPAPADEKPVSVFDIDATSDRFSMIGNRPAPPYVAPPPTDTARGEEPPPPPPPPPADDTKFLGVVRMGAAKLALIARADKQSFVGVGGRVGDETVTAISEKEITIGSKTIPLTPKGSEVVSRASSADAGAGAMGAKGNTAGMPGVSNGRTNPATAATLAARAAASRAANSRAAAPGGSMGAPMAPFPDPVRNNRYQQLLEKLRAGGEFKTEAEVAEAAMKYTENEAITGQLQGFDSSLVKKK